MIEDLRIIFFTVSISILILIIVDIPTNGKFSIIFFMILLPGYLITLQEEGSKLSTTIVKVIVVGLAILMYYSIYLSYFHFEVNLTNLMTLNILLTTILAYIKRKKLFIKINNMVILRYNKKDVLDLVFLFIIMAVPILLFKNTTLHEYYMGIDPYLQMDILRKISEKTDILGSDFFCNPFYGFYYFIHSVTQLIGINFHYFTKYFWLINISLILGTIYIILIDKSKITLTLVIPIIFLSNQFVMNRFVMSIRENFSFLFLLGLIFYLNEKEHKKQEGGIVEMALLYGAILLTHPITFLYASAVVTFQILKEIMQRDQAYLTTMKVFLGLVFAFPMLNVLVKYFIWFILWKIQIALGSSYVPPHPGGLSTFEVLRAWTKPIEITDFSKYALYAAPLGFLSFIYEIYKNRTIRFFFIFPWLGLTLLMLVLTELGFYQSPSRLIIYIAFNLSFFSGILIENLYTSSSKKKYIPKFNLKLLTLPSIKIDGKLFSLLLVLVMLMSVIFTSLNDIHKFTKYSPFEKNHIDGIKDFISCNNNESYILLPYPEEIAMFIYLGTTSTVTNYTQLVDIYNSSSIDILRQKITQYKGIENIYFIISNRNLHKDIFPLLKLLNMDFKYMKIKGITVYKYI